MSSVVVLGAGPAGAASALFLARRGRAVTVIDRESYPQPEPDGRDDGGERHVRQGHSFLALGTHVLDEEAPDIVAALQAAGADRVGLRHDPGYWNLLSRRSLLDRVLREALRREPNVTFMPGTAATGLLFADRAGDTFPHVDGVSTAAGPVRGDLVIDASGRKSSVPQWFKAAGSPLSVDDDHTPFVYITRHYRLRDGEAFPSVQVPILEALDYATVLAFPEDDRRFQLSVQLDCRDPAKRALLEAATFDRFVGAVPLTAPWLARGDPLTDPEAFASIGNRRTRTCLDHPLATGLLLVGDAALHTNPTAARGVALALRHAQALADLVDRLAGAPAEQVALAWDRETDAVLGPWLESQIRIDNDRRAQIRSSILGRSWAPSNELSHRLAGVLAADDAPEEIRAVRDRLLNLLTTPQAVFSDRTVMRHLYRETRKETVGASPRGPSRREFERLTLEPESARR